MSRFYSEEDAEAILRSAASRSGTEGVSRERLLAMAEELGLSVEAVERAEREHLLRNEETRLTAEFAGRQRGELFHELGQYVGIGALLIGIWYMTGHGYFWPGWPLGVFTLALVGEVVQRLIPASPSYQRRLRRFIEKRMAPPAVSPDVRAILEGPVAVELSKGADINAIKVLREQTGMGLKEAKDAVDDFKLEIRLGRKY